MTWPTAPLIDAARQAAGHAHAPYSGFAVGAALRLENGDILTGSNLENASYGLSLCAEAAALAAANSAGRLRDVREIAVIGGTLKNGHLQGTAPVHPCGRCRQMLKEASDLAGHDILVHCAAPEGGQMAHYPLSTLLPYAFGPADLARD